VQGEIAVKWKGECTNLLPDDDQKWQKHVVVIHVAVLSEHSDKFSDLYSEGDWFRTPAGVPATSTKVLRAFPQFRQTYTPYMDNTWYYATTTSFNFPSN
jgi:hypothetical protein